MIFLTLISNIIKNVPQQSGPIAKEGTIPFLRIAPFNGRSYWIIIATEIFKKSTPFSKIFTSIFLGHLL